MFEIGGFGILPQESLVGASLLGIDMAVSFRLVSIALDVCWTIQFPNPEELLVRA